jgi:carbonic anhydrase/acetyltransferase-like protein (isoleucine patch superfamily)
VRAVFLSAGRSGCYLGYSLAARETRRCGVFLVPAITYGKIKLLIRTPDIRPYKGKYPQIAASAYIDPAAVVIGDVEIGEESSVWPMCVVRGDVHHIRIGKRTNIQDGCVLHVMKDQYPLVLGDEVTVGHSVTLHGCAIHSHVLIGMGCVILNGAVIGENSIIAAGTLITERTVIPAGSLVMGSPGKVKRELTDEDCESIGKYAERYAGYSVIYREEAAERGEQIDWSKLED